MGFLIKYNLISIVLDLNVQTLKTGGQFDPLDFDLQLLLLCL